MRFCTLITVASIAAHVTDAFSLRNSVASVLESVADSIAIDSTVAVTNTTGGASNSEQRLSADELEAEQAEQNAKYNAAQRDAYIYLDVLRTPSNGMDGFMKDLIAAGANNLILAFNMHGHSGGDQWDSVPLWEALSDSEKESVLAAAHAKNGRIILSTGGATYGTEIYLSQDPAEWAKSVCGYASDQKYDGVDFDLENFVMDRTFFDWAVTATKECRKYIDFITHAPQAPHFNTAYPANYEELLPYVDKLLIQYYNQGTWAPYDTFEMVFTSDPTSAADVHSLKTQRDAGDKIVVGKAIYSEFVYNTGLWTADELHTHLTKAEKEHGYTGGYMLWRAPNPDEQHYDDFMNYALPLLSQKYVSEATVASTAAPTVAPTVAPTTTSTAAPTTTSTIATTTTSTAPPTHAPTVATTRAPTSAPTVAHTSAPTVASTAAPALITTKRASLPNIVQTSVAATSAAVQSTKVAACQESITSSNPDWTTHCQGLCDHYANAGAAFCPSANDGLSLAKCVALQASYCSVII